MVVLAVGRASIGLVAPLRFKWLDSQPVKSDVGPVPIDFHDFHIFFSDKLSWLPGLVFCFRPGRPRFRLPRHSVGTKRCGAKSHADS